MTPMSNCGNEHRSGFRKWKKDEVAKYPNASETLAPD